MRGRVGQPGHERQELGEATRPAICQDQRGSAAAAGPFVHKMHPDTIDLGPEVTEPVQPAFLRAPVEAVRPVRQQVPEVTEVCTLLPRRPWPRPRPPRVSDPRTQVGEDLVAHPDTELLRPEGCHPASLARYRHLERPWLTAGSDEVSGHAESNLVGTEEQEGIVSDNQLSLAGRYGGHALRVERIIA